MKLPALALLVASAVPAAALAASVELVVLSGAGAKREPSPSPPRVHLVLDVTESMATALGGESGAGLTRLDAARVAASRFLQSLPNEQAVTLHTLGVVEGSACPAAAPADFPSGEAAARYARSARPRSEGSLAATLDSLAVAQQGRDELARVVVVGDLAADCGGDLCRAAARLLEANATLDVVAVGGPGPPCLASAADLSRPAWQAAPAPGPISFRVSAAADDGSRVALASGESGAGPVEATAAQAWVEVDLSPVLRIGPVALPPDGVTRIEVVDFPAASPALREAYVDGARVAASP